MDDQALIRILQEALIPDAGGGILAQQLGLNRGDMMSTILGGMLQTLIPGQVNLHSPNFGITRALRSQRTSAVAGHVMRNEDFANPFSAARSNQIDSNIESILTPLLPSINRTFGTDFEVNPDSINMVRELVSMMDIVAGTNILGSLTNISDPNAIAYNLSESVRNSHLSSRDRMDAAREMSTAFSERVIRRNADGEAIGEDRRLTRGLTAQEFSEVINIGMNAGLINARTSGGAIDQASALSGVVAAGREAFGTEDIDTILRLAREVNGTLDAGSAQEIEEAFRNLASILSVANVDGQEFLSQVDMVRQIGGPRMSTRAAMQVVEDTHTRRVSQIDRTGRSNEIFIATTAKSETSLHSSDFAARATIAIALGLDPNDPRTTFNPAFQRLRAAVEQDPAELQRIREGMSQEQREQVEDITRARGTAETEQMFLRSYRSTFAGADAESMLAFREDVGAMLESGVELTEEALLVSLQNIFGDNEAFGEERLRSIANTIRVDTLTERGQRNFLNFNERAQQTEGVADAAEVSRRSAEALDMFNQEEESDVARINLARNLVLRTREGEKAFKEDAELFDIAVAAEDPEVRDEALRRLSRTTGISQEVLGHMIDAISSSYRDEAESNLAALGVLDEDGNITLNSDRHSEGIEGNIKISSDDEDDSVSKTQEAKEAEDKAGESGKSVATAQPVINTKIDLYLDGRKLKAELTNITGTAV